MAAQGAHGNNQNFVDDKHHKVNATRSFNTYKEKTKELL